MSTPADHDVVRELRARADAGIPPMSLDPATVRAVGRRRLLGRRLAAGVAVAAVLALGVVAVSASWLRPPPGLGPAGGNGPTSTSHATLQLRLVTSTSGGPCSDPPLTSDGPGRACDRTGGFAYELGPTLGEVTPTTATPTETQGAAQVTIALDQADSATLDHVTRSAVGRRLAILLDGRVIMASIVVDPITGGQFALGTATSAEAQQLAAALNGTTSSPDVG
jgi:hypothetical protein